MDLTDFNEEQIAMLPPDMLGEIVGHLPVETLLTLCESSQRVNWICHADNVWYALLRRDFPQFKWQPGMNARQAYEQQYALVKALGRQRIQKAIDGLRRRELFWMAISPGRTRTLAGALRVLQDDPVRNAGLVYWPDMRVVGTPQQILDVLQQNFITRVRVGELNRLTQGRLGQPSQILPVTLETIVSNSIDPSDPAHAEEIPSIREQYEAMNRADQAERQVLDDFYRIH